MRFGIYIFPSEDTISPVRLAVEAEARGFESVFFPDHTHIPVSRETEFPYADEAYLRSMYLHMFDPFIALATAASVTSTIRLGTAVTLVPERDPIILAKQVATLDVLSGGRVELGVGPGWNAEELRNHGGDPARRFRSLRERVEAMRAIWADDEAEYHGETVDFDPIYSWPKPVQRRIPVLMGGGSAAIPRAIRYADGWMPIRHQQDTAAMMERVRTMCEEAGRDPATLPVTVCGGSDDPAEIGRFRAAGIARVLFMLPPLAESPALEQLDLYAKYIHG